MIFYFRNVELSSTSFSNVLPLAREGGKDRAFIRRSGRGSQAQQLSDSNRGVISQNGLQEPTQFVIISLGRVHHLKINWRCQREPRAM